MPVLTNQAARLISCGILCSHFSGTLLLSFLLGYDFGILVKSRGGVHSNVTSVSIQFGFFKWNAKCPVYHFLGLKRRILNLIYLNISRKGQVYIAFVSFLFRPPARLWKYGLDLSVHDTVWLGSDNIKIATCCQEGVRPRRKMKMPKKLEQNINFFLEIFC